MVRAILEQPMDFVDNESFHVPRARQRIFDKADPVRRADVGWYQPLMHDLGASPKSSSNKDSIVLTRAEEATLFLQYNFSRFKVASIQKRIGSKKKPTATQSSELLSWYRVSRGLRDQIAESNLALVLAMAKRIRINSQDFSDQISEGNMALLRSVDKFDIGRGFKFSTYACRSILKAFARQGMKDTRQRKRFPTTFDPMMESCDAAADRRQQSEREGATEVKQLMLDNTVDLSEIEQVVLQHRFGFEPGRSGRPMTLTQVGSLIGVTKERVRQIQNKALKKLREAVEQRRLPRSQREHPAAGWGLSPS
jgi:RNA polymerase sigma factor (sigma-70 family)